MVFGIVTILIAAWGGVVPFVGPLFGYRADGATPWTWNLAQAVLGLAPGIIGVLAGLAIASAGGRLSLGIGKASLAGAGFVASLAGAWFVIGPDAWTVLSTKPRYFVGTSPFRALVDLLGYSFGPGLILAVCGGCAIGWAVRHRYSAPVRSGGHGLRLHHASAPGD